MLVGCRVTGRLLQLGRGPAWWQRLGPGGGGLAAFCSSLLPGCTQPTGGRHPRVPPTPRGTSNRLLAHPSDVHGASTRRGLCWSPGRSTAHPTGPARTLEDTEHRCAWHERTPRWCACPWMATPWFLDGRSGMGAVGTQVSGRGGSLFVGRSRIDWVSVEHGWEQPLAAGGRGPRPRNRGSGRIWLCVRVRADPVVPTGQNFRLFS